MARAIIRKDSTGKYSAIKLRYHYEAPYFIRNVPLYINYTSYLMYVDPESSPIISKLQNKNLLKMCKDKLRLYFPVCEKVVFQKKRVQSQ